MAGWGGRARDALARTRARSPLIAGLWIVALLALAALAVPAPAAATMVVARHNVSTDPALQDEPDVGGTWVVWSDHRNGTWDIYGRDLSGGGEVAICSAAGDQTHPRVSGDWVVWQDHRSATWDIYAYDLATHSEVAVCTAAHQQVAPRVCGGEVVWQDDRGGDWDVWGASLGAVPDPQPLVAAAGDQTAPDLAPHWLVWIDTRGGGRDIWALDRLTVGSQPFAVTTGSARQDEPAVSGDVVVWRDFRNLDAGAGTDLYAHDLGADRTWQLVGTPGDQESPAIDGDLVVYSDYRSMAAGKTRFGPDISCYDLTLQTALTVYSGLGAQNKPAVDGLTVVWADWRAAATGADIWAATLSAWTATVSMTPSSLWLRRPTVDVGLFAQTKNPGASVTQMRLERAGDPVPAVFEPYVTTAAGWALSWNGEDGPCTLRVVFRDDSGLPSPQDESPVVSRTVTLDTHGPVTRAPHAALEEPDGSAALQFRVDDELSPTAAVTLSVRTSAGRLVRSVKVVAAPTGKLQWRRISCAGLALGTYRYTVSATDLAGNPQTQAGANRLVVH